MRCQSPQLLQQITTTVNNMGVDLFSPWIDTLQVDYLSWQIEIGAGATGTLTLQGTNQDNPNVNAPTNPITLPAATPALTNPAGGAVNQIVSAPGLGVGGARYQRLKYAFGSGNGKLNLWVTGAAKE